MSDQKDYDPLDDDSVLSPPEAEEDGWMAEGVGQRMNVFEGLHTDSPIQPVELKPDTRFRFRCHKGVSCWNSCCHGADITLTPYDILQLARFFSVRPKDIVADFAVPAIHEASGMPVPKLIMRGKEGKGACVFLDEEEGCKVYEARPATCRYYPLGRAAMKMKGHEQRTDMYFLVREDYCKGHEEPREQTVEKYLQQQGLEPYDVFNARWEEILMKAASWRSVGGPYGKAIPKPMLQMFYMICTDVDKFREFIFESTFLERYDVPEDVQEALKKSDETLILFGFDWLKHVIFGEETVKLKDEVFADAYAEARDNWMKYGELRNTWKYKGRKKKEEKSDDGAEKSASNDSASSA